MEHTDVVSHYRTALEIAVRHERGEAGTEDLRQAMIHYRAQWRGRKAAWFGVVGFALVVFTFLGTRLMGGYHVFG